MLFELQPRALRRKHVELWALARAVARVGALQRRLRSVARLRGRGDLRIERTCCLHRVGDLVQRRHQRLVVAGDGEVVIGIGLGQLAAQRAAVEDRQADRGAAEAEQRVAAEQFGQAGGGKPRSEEHTSELQSLMRISYAVFCLKKKKK